MALWTPKYTPTQVWVNFADATTITLVDDKISVADDQSGNGIDLVQTTSGQRPDYAVVTINSLNTASFVSAQSEGLQTASNPFGASISNAHVFMIYKTPATLEAATNFSLSASVTTKWGAHAPWSDAACYFDVDGASGANRITKTSFATTSEELMASFYCSTTEGVQELWKNGTKVASDATGHTADVDGNIFLSSVKDR